MCGAALSPQTVGWTVGGVTADRSVSGRPVAFGVYLLPPLLYLPFLSLYYRCPVTTDGLANVTPVADFVANVCFDHPIFQNQMYHFMSFEVNIYLFCIIVLLCRKQQIGT